MRFNKTALKMLYKTTSQFLKETIDFDEKVWYHIIKERETESESRQGPSLQNRKG